MLRQAYDTRTWRELPRDGDCVVEVLFGGAVGPCHGLTHRHHVDPNDPDSRSFQVCAKHHPKLSISVYHAPDHPVEVPRVIREAWSGYRMECGPCAVIENARIRPDVLYFH